MIHFESFELANGLRCHVIPQPDTSVAVMNLMYDVGSKDESPTKTGFAHLFEHLMFGGSQNIKDFDTPLQRVGGNNNAFTSPDLTNYYLTLPASNLETGFWLESDRMLSLSFDPKVLEVQRSVVIEEFKQRYLNQPYGDAMLQLLPMVYQQHPYRWPTIGKEIAHIEQATMQDVKDFFFTHYRPNRAVLVVAGQVTTAQVERLAKKWFGPIEAGPAYQRQLPAEPEPTEHRRRSAQADVPQDALYRSYLMPGRAEKEYYAADMVSDVLGRGKSSRLHQALVVQQQLFTQVGSYVSGAMEPGQLHVQGKLRPEVSLDQAEAAVDQVLQQLVDEGPGTRELEKVKNQALASVAFGHVELLNQAMSLAYADLLGEPAEVNREQEKLKAVTAEQVHQQARHLLQPHRANTLHYHKQAS